MARPVLNGLQRSSKEPTKADGASASLRFRFGPFCFDLADHRLEREGTHIPLTPREFDVLRVLIENAGHLVAKETLLERVWSGTVVEEANLSVHVSRIRRLLGTGASGDEQYIETVPKFGYRFVAPVRVAPGSAHARTPSPSTASGPPPRRARLKEGRGEPVRLTIQLVRLRDGETLWTEAVEGVLRNPPSLREQIAEEVVEILARLKPERRDRPRTGAMAARRGCWKTPA